MEVPVIFHGDHVCPSTSGSDEALKAAGLRANPFPSPKCKP